MVALLETPVNPLRIGPGTGAERRRFPRRQIHCSVEGRRIDHTVVARQRPRVRMVLRDLSVGGLSASSDAPLQAGERVGVYVPPQQDPAYAFALPSLNRGWDAVGRVIRCSPAGNGYQVAIEFDMRPAA